VYFNECSQIPMGSVDIATDPPCAAVQRRCGTRRPRASTRAAQGAGLSTTATRRQGALVLQAVHPEDRPGDGKPLSNPDDYESFQINPGDNVENLSKSYLQTLQGMSAGCKSAS
jgi:hypothetical protein